MKPVDGWKRKRIIAMLRDCPQLRMYEIAATEGVSADVVRGINKQERVRVYPKPKNVRGPEA